VCRERNRRTAKKLQQDQFDSAKNARQMVAVYSSLLFFKTASISDNTVVRRVGFVAMPLSSANH